MKFRLRGDRAYLSREEKRFFALFVLIVLFKFGYFGYAYVPYLDDYVQYGMFPKMENVAQSVFWNGARTIYTRPFATIADVYVIGRLGLSGLGIWLFIMTFLYAVSAMLFYIAFKGIDVRFSPLFAVIYGLSPIAVEGTYWVSAASRIVLPLFFTSLTLFLAVKYRGGLGAYGTVLIWLCNLLSYGFYEQVAVLAFVLCMYFAIRIKSRKLGIIACINFVLLAVYYLVFAWQGDNAERVSLKGISGIFSSAVDVGREIMLMWLKYGIKLNFTGFKRGFEILIGDKSFLWLIAMSALVMLAFGAMSRIKSYKVVLKNCEKKLRWLTVFKSEKLIMGILLFAVPYIPFFITGNVWLNFRNATASVLGFAMIFDAVFGGLIRSSEARAFVTSVIMVFCLIVNVSEVSDYMRVAHSDLLIVQNVARGVSDETKEVRVTLKEGYDFEQNAYMRDHIISLTKSYYGICGAVRALSGNYTVEVEIE